MPKLPPEIRKILNKLSISPKVIEDVLDNQSICGSVLAQIKAGDEGGAKRLVFWFLQAEVDEDKQIDSDNITKLSQMVERGELNSNAAQEIFNEMLESADDPRKIAESKNLIQVSDEAELDEIVAEILAANQKAAEDIKNGEIKAIGYLVGQVMAKSQGKANPRIAQSLIKKQLGL